MPRNNVAQYVATQDQTTFSVNFTVYDISYVSVFLTPNGTVANDASNILPQTAYYGTNYEVGGSITLKTPANAGDIVTIIYNMDDALLVPTYPLCSTADTTADGILPILPPGCTWVKSSDGTKIQTQSLQSTHSVDLPTVQYAATRYKDANGSTQSSNTILQPTRISHDTYRDNVSGINNLTITGSINITNNATQGSWTTIGESINVPMGGVTTLSLELNHQNDPGYSTTFLGANQNSESFTNITYTLPPYQATIAGSFLSNDADGNLSWAPQSDITQVGNVISGTWDAGNIRSTDISSTGNITAAGNIKAGLDGVGTFPGSVNTTSLIIGDSGSPTFNTSTITSPENFSDSYTYVWPQTIGTTGNVLTIQTSTPTTATLAWQDNTTFKYVWVRFHLSSAFEIIIANNYGISGVNRISTGIYDILFNIPFTSATSYVWQTTGYSSTSSGVNNGIFYILQLDASWGNGKNPQPESCRFVLYNDQQNVQDPIQTAVSPNASPDVCIMFMGY